MNKYSEVYAAKYLVVNPNNPKGKGTWKSVGTAFRGVSLTNGTDYFTIVFDKAALPLSIDQVHLFPVSLAQKNSTEGKKTE